MYTAILFRTHILNYAICNNIKKIYNECNNFNINQNNHYLIFHLLIPDNITYPIPDEFKEFTKIYNEEKDIKSLYKNIKDDEFKNIYYSNHFITLWFFKYFGKTYENFWSIDYDVKILGSSLNIFSNNTNFDLLIPKNIIEKNGFFITNTQICRLSKFLLKKIHKNIKKGNNFSYEIIYALICKKYNFSYDYTFLNSFIQGVWTNNTEYNKHNIESYNRITKNKNNVKTYIFHPIKNITDKEIEEQIIYRTNLSNTIL